MHQSAPLSYEGKVFVIDDDDDLRESLAEALEDEHFLVLPGRNGHEALSRMRGVLPPRVAVVDLAMPDMNGWQLVETMKSDPKLAEIPVIILSGSGSVSRSSSTNCSTPSANVVKKTATNLTHEI